MSTLTLVASAFLQPGIAHQQCLDFQPPFTSEEMSYCSEYQDFGCCIKRQDNRAQKATIIASVKLTNIKEKLKCNEYLRNISCLSCSPYCAHIYGTEAVGESRFFPELCQDYYVEAYVKCRLALIRMLTIQPWRNGLVSKCPKNAEVLTRDVRAFCEHYIPADLPYCYQRVLDAPSLERFSTEQVGELGCICG